MKVFFQHRKQILASIKQQMSSEKHAQAVTRKKVVSWIIIMKMRQIYQEKLLENFNARLTAKQLHTRRLRCIGVIIKAFKKLKSKREGFVGVRLGGPTSIRYPRYQFTYACSLLSDKYQDRARHALRSFLQDTAEIYNIINKVSQHGQTVSTV